MSARLPRIALAPLRRRARAPQPRHGGAVGRRRARRVTRRRRRLEGRAARRRPGRRDPRCPVAAGAALGRPARPRLCSDRASSTGSCHRAWLDGAATQRGQLFAARHDLIPVAAYFLGRLLVLTPVAWRRLSLALVGVAVALTAWGLADVYLVPLQWWRDSGVPGWFEEQLGLVYRGLSGLPENWVLNTGDEENPIRRLVSTFLSPLATALRARDRPALPRRPPPHVVDGRRGRRRLRRPPLDAHARRVPRARARPRRARGRRSAASFRSCSRSRRSSSGSAS